MKNFHVWALADLAIIGLALASAWLTFHVSAKMIPMLVAYIAGFFAFLLVDRMLARWYYNGTSDSKKMFGGEDDYDA